MRLWLRRAGAALCAGLSVYGNAWAQCNIAQVAAGSDFSLALGRDGRLWAWGYNGYGQLGIGGFDDQHMPVEVLPLPAVVSVRAGSVHSVALTADGDLWVWGGNSDGQLGNGGSGHVDLPLRLLTDLSVIGAGSWNSYAVGIDGRVLAWGANESGQLGDGSRADSNVPVEVTGLASVGLVQIVGGNGHSLGLADDGNVWAWGGNGNGQLGDGTLVDSLVPQLVPGLGEIVAITADASSSFAVGSDGAVWAWGGRFLGDGSSDGSKTPVRAAISNVVAASGHKVHALTIRSGGSVWGWGSNQFGELARDPVSEPFSAWPARIDGPESVVSVAAGAYFSLAADSDGRVFAWGYNHRGQLGNGTTIDSAIPISLPLDPVPPDQGNVLRAVRRGDDVELSFSGAPATRWRLYHDPDKLTLGTTALIPDAVATTYTDAVALLRAESDYYELRGLSPCSSTPGP